MEASAFGTPVQTEPPATPAPETTPEPAVQAEPTAPAVSQTPATPEASEDPVMAAIAELGAKFEASRQPEPAAQPDLLTALTAEPEPVQPEPGQEPAAADPNLEDPAAQQQFEELQAFVRQEAQQIVSPFIQRQQEKDIRALQQEYPDIIKPEVLEPLEEVINGFVEETGNPDLALNADFVRRAYKMVKAEQADATAVPAEQVATQPSLETNAGGTQMGSPSGAEQYIADVYGSRAAPSVFQGG